MEASKRDVVVVGAGLAGMMAALSLAQAGRSVLLVDRRTHPGGRCGTFELDGYRFTIGCNDFGARIVRDLASVGVHVEFVPSTNVIDFGDAVYRLPPGPVTALQLLRHVPSVLSTVWRIKRGGRKQLGALFDERDRSRLGFRFISCSRTRLARHRRRCGLTWSVPTSPSSTTTATTGCSSPSGARR
jgi:hypothetical protein